MPLGETSDRAYW
ncbi:hypothetical protein LINPERHAP1_LOCUS10101 [Linum perenne]